MANSLNKQMYAFKVKHFLSFLKKNGFLGRVVLEFQKT